MCFAARFCNLLLEEIDHAQQTAREARTCGQGGLEKALKSLKVDMSKITKRIQKDPKGQCRLRKNINESSKKRSNM